MKLLLFIVTIITLGSEVYAEADRIIYVTQTGGPTFYQGHSIRTEEFLTGIKKARAGTKVIVLPGTYRGRYIISKQSDPANPIIISGVEGLTVFACGDLPENKGDSPVKFSVAKGLVFENFRFESCWPSPIEVTDSSYLIFRNNIFHGGFNAIRIAEQSSHSIQITNNVWNQDRTKSELWQTNPASLKQGDALADYQGGFVHTNGVLGNLLITHNIIEHSYSFLTCKSESRHRQPTKNVILKNNIIRNLRGDFLGINCDIKNLFVAHNLLERFGLVINNQGHASQSIFWGNIFAEGGGVAPNYLISNKGEVDGLKFVNNTVEHVDHFMATGSTGAISTLEIQNNIFSFAKEEQYWKGLTSAKNYKLTDNLWNRLPPKEVKQVNATASDFSFTSDDTHPHHLDQKGLVKDKGSNIAIGPSTPPFFGRSLDIGAFDGDLPVGLPNFEWLTLTDIEDALILGSTVSEGRVSYALSRNPAKSAAVTGTGIGAEGQREEQISCRVDRGSLSLLCPSSVKALHKIGFSSRILEDAKLLPWPVNDNLEIIEELPKREKLIDLR